MIYLSPTRLQRYYESGCPAKWNYEREWEPREKNEFAERGTLVHRMLSGDIDLSIVEDPLAHNFYRKLKDAELLMGFNAVERELRQEFPLTDDVMWVRVIDAKGFIGQTQYILDYKTTGAVWKSLVEGITPQTLAMQSPGYLWSYEPDWPAEMLYLVAGFRGPAATFRYQLSEADRANFMEAVTMCASALKAGYNPKIRGKGCLDCEMKDVCYDLPGWKKKYTKKKSGRSRT